MSVPESAEVRREMWARGDWPAVSKRWLPSREWLYAKFMPKSATDWYLAAIICMAILNMLGGYIRMLKKFTSQGETDELPDA